jgi:hypothetical protein
MDVTIHRKTEEHVSRVTQICHVPTQTVTAVTAGTADTSVASASDPAPGHRPEVRRVSRFQHRFGIPPKSRRLRSRRLRSRRLRSRRLRSRRLRSRRLGSPKHLGPITLDQVIWTKPSPDPTTGEGQSANHRGRPICQSQGKASNHRGRPIFQSQGKANHRGRPIFQSQGKASNHRGRPIFQSQGKANHRGPPGGSALNARAGTPPLGPRNPDRSAHHRAQSPRQTGVAVTGVAVTGVAVTGLT